MEVDLAVSALLIGALAFLAGAFGHRIGGCLNSAWRHGLFAMSMVCGTVHASILVGRLELAEFFSVGAAIVTSNVTPIFIIFAIGLVWSAPVAGRPKRQVRLAGLGMLSVAFLVAPIMRPLIRPVVSDETARMDDGVCLQSHPATCAAAAAATILQHHRIAVTERQMIAACLTSCNGTEPLGLFRGLRSQTATRALRPQLASTEAATWQSLNQFPLIALISFGRENESDVTSLQWILGRQGEGHAIVVFGISENGDYLIGDPAFGRTVWDEGTFQRRFSGHAIYLAKR